MFNEVSNNATKDSNGVGTVKTIIRDELNVLKSRLQTRTEIRGNFSDTLF